MAGQTGVWLDYRKALVVSLDGDNVRVTHIQSDVERKHRSTGGVRSRWPWWHRTAKASDLVGKRRGQEIRRYYQDISRAAGDTEDLFIFGPGGAKTGLTNFLAKHIRTSVADEQPEAAGSRMSEAEIVARIKEHFGSAAPRLNLSERMLGH